MSGDTGDVGVDEIFSIIEGELEWRVSEVPPEATLTQPSVGEISFDEKTYLAAFPRHCRSYRGRASGHPAYIIMATWGEKESRLNDLRYRNVAGVEDTIDFPAGAIDAVFLTQSGWCLVIGWMHDENIKLHEIVCHKGRDIIAVIFFFCTLS